MVSRDEEIREAAFAYVDRITEHGEGVVTWSELNSFTYMGERIHLVSQQGIFKPAGMDLPISIRTTYRPPGEQRPYEDEIGIDGYLLYRYRGTDPSHYQNQWLRQVRAEGIALLYLEGVAKGIYQAHAAVIVDDHPTDLTFSVQLLPVDTAAYGPVGMLSLDAGARRHYLTLAKRRAGQEAFRQVVLTAYGRQCSLCRLRHTELLDAAHIIPDSEGGPLTVTNGMSMCKIHHAAYDAHIIGVRPDHVAEVRADILTEVDGPMLRHGLQDLHGTRVHVPSRPVHRPNREALERRYERFRTAV